MYGIFPDLYHSRVQEILRNGKSAEVSGVDILQEKKKTPCMQAKLILKFKECVTLLLIAATGCISKIYIDYDKHADFTEYQTHA